MRTGKDEDIKKEEEELREHSKEQSSEPWTGQNSECAEQLKQGDL